MSNLSYFKKKTLFFFGILLFLILVFSLMFQKHFSTDGYYFIQNPFVANHMNLGLGRLGDYLINLFFNSINFNFMKHQEVCVIFLMCSCSFMLLNICNIKTLIEKDETIKNTIFFIVLLLPYCVNVFILEWYFYVEMNFAWGFSLIFLTLSIMCLDINVSILKMLGCFIFEAVSISFYQASLGIFVGLAFIKIFYILQASNKKFSHLLRSFCLVIITAGLASISNLLFIKLVQLFIQNTVTGRTENISFGLLINNIKNVFKEFQIYVINSHNLLPKYCFFIISIASIGMFIYWLSNQKNAIEFKIMYIISYIISILAVLAPHFLTSNLWMAQRTIVGIVVIIILPLAYIYLDPSVNRIQKNACLIIGASFLFINTISINRISSDFITSNKLDSMIAHSIEGKINEYILETNRTVDKICVIYDTNRNWVYPEIKGYGYDSHVKAYATPWSDVNCINYYNGKNYKKVDSHIDVTRLQNNKDWNYFDTEKQLIFVDDVLYLIVY